jgi:hypothetical protein
MLRANATELLSHSQLKEERRSPPGKKGKKQRVHPDWKRDRRSLKAAQDVNLKHSAKPI